MKTFKQFILEQETNEVPVSQYFHKDWEPGSFGHSHPLKEVLTKAHINIRHISPSQDTVNRKQVEAFRKKKPRGRPLLAKNSDTHYTVIDGHHRIASDIANGKTHIHAHVVHMDMGDDGRVTFSKIK